MAALKSAVRDRLGPRRIAAAKRQVAPLLRHDLTRLGRWYGTDKAYEKHLYTPIYERHLGHLRRRPIKLLEIGIGGYSFGLQAGGSSLRMWRTWLPKAQIVGIDLEERAFGEPRITTLAGSQADPAFLLSVVDRHGPFEVIIDDGSHMSEHIIISFETLWPLVPPNGIYVIEDLNYSYEADRGGGPPGTSGTSVEMIKQLVDGPTIGGDVAAIHVYPKLALIEKRG